MKLLWFLFLGISSVSSAQFSFYYNGTIPVVESGIALGNAWGGGLNYIQISDFDFDQDGDLDLFVFDRSSDNIRVFTKEGALGNESYVLAHNSKQYFPSDLREKALLVDYDMDGRKDLFTQGISGLKVYRNVSTMQNGLQWTLVKELVFSEYTTSNAPLFVSSDDIPAIVDVDYDGDIDILTFHPGGETMEYHQNQSMDLYGVPDSLVFELRNQCWGKFREDPVTSSILLNDSNYPCVGGDIPNPEKMGQEHAGSTILAYDFDNSGVIDLVIGDVSFTNLSLLMNSGNAPNMDSPMVSVDLNFPSNTTPADMSVFPASFMVDGDFDGVMDLIVGANAAVVSENERSILFYKNIGTNQLPIFSYASNNFLQAEMIDHGTGAMPTFADLNEDGLEDLIVANLYRYKPVLGKESTLAYYQNTGTINNPEFTLIDTDFLNLSNEIFGLRTVPTFGDLDGDGDQDLLLGRDNGTLVYYENASVGGGASYGLPQLNYTDHLGQVISTTTSCFPQLFDLDKDGLLDLLLGRLNGEISYYKNVGTAMIPSFELMNATLGNVSVASSIPNTFSAPHFFRRNDTTHLFMGDFDGRLGYYSEIDGNLASGLSFSLVTDNYLDVDAGKYSSFWVNDINNNGLLDLFVGQDLGGLYHMEADSLEFVSIKESESNFTVKIWPNPSSSKIQIKSEGASLEHVQIIDVRGRVIVSESASSANITLNLERVKSGVYYVNIRLTDGSLVMKKLLLH